jgi:5-methylthioadenosine/S-adenosylhomocysteine deaminase
VIDGARIVWVGPARDAPEGVRHDLGASVLLPGLVNVHTHLELTAMRGLLEDLPFRRWIVRLTRARQGAMTPERARAAARVGIAEGVLAGITTFGDASDAGHSLEALQSMGARGIVFQEVFGPDPAQCAEALAGLRERVEALQSRASDLVTVGVSPHAPYTVSDDLFVATARLARAASLPMSIHISESQAEWDYVVRATGPFAEGLQERGIAVGPRGASPIALLDRLEVLHQRPLLVHLVNASSEDLALVAARACPIAHCPASNAKLGHGVAPVTDLQELGVTVALGTDSVASSNRMDLLDEARLAVLHQRARAKVVDTPSAAQALAMATIEGARALGLERRIGSLEPGKDADLAAFPLDEVRDAPALDPATVLVFGAAGRRPSLVTVAGREIVRQGLLGPDLRDDLRLLRETAEDLRANMPPLA